MNNTKTVSIVATLALIAGAAVAFVLFASAPHASGEVTKTQSSSAGLYKNYTFFGTTTAQTTYATTTATSTNITQWTDSTGAIDTGTFVIAGAKHVNLLFQREGSGTGNANNAGSSQFKIQVAATSTGAWYDYNVLTFNSATGTTPTVAQIVSLSGTTTQLMSMRDLGFWAIRCVAIQTTDGTNFCSASADY